MRSHDCCGIVAEIVVLQDPPEVDWSALHALLHRSYAYMDARIDPPSSLHRLTVEGLCEKAQDETLFLALLDEQIVGCLFCRLQGEWLYVGKVAVEEELQGRGVGRNLFDRAFSLARQRDCSGLELEVRVELIENHQAFANMGFGKVGEDAHEGYDQPTSIRMRATI